MSELVQENVQEQALEGSETSENNVISESEYQEDVSSDEVGQEDESRKFQSMYDKSEAELAKLRPVAQLFQDNPELVDVVRNHLSGGKEQEKDLFISQILIGFLTKSSPGAKITDRYCKE